MTKHDRPHLCRGVVTRCHTKTVRQVRGRIIRYADQDLRLALVWGSVGTTWNLLNNHLDPLEPR